MRITDKCSMRDKRIEKKLRDMELLVDQMGHENRPEKETFISLFVMTLELFIDAYHVLEDNTLPGKTLIEYTPTEVKDACFRVGEAKHFGNDPDFVIAVMQELR